MQKFLRKLHKYRKGELCQIQLILKSKNYFSSCAKMTASVKEGLATIQVTNETSTDVFYNPVQQFNRDMSIAVINQFIKDNEKEEKKHHLDNITVLEALSATGLRSIRYAKEIPKISKIIANDFSKRAVESIQKNIEDNNVTDTVEASHADAKDLMGQHKSLEKRFAIVDLDPYGSPTPFLDGALQSVADGGLLCVTCTDMAVLCGNASETCYTKYGAISLRGKNCHEMALRIVLQCIESHANRYGRYMVPLLSLSIDFYVRVFVKVYTSQKVCKQTTSKLGNLYLCTGCEAMTVQPLGQLVKDEKGNVKYVLPKGPPVDRKCKFCLHSHLMGGPFWINPMHDQDFVKRLIEGLDEPGAAENLGTIDRMKGMLAMVSEELPDVPFYYTYDRYVFRSYFEWSPREDRGFAPIRATVVRAKRERLWGRNEYIKNPGSEKLRPKHHLYYLTSMGLTSSMGLFSWFFCILTCKTQYKIAFRNFRNIQNFRNFRSFRNSWNF